MLVLSRSISRLTLLILAVLLLSTFELNAQEEEKKKKGYMARRDSVKEAKIAEGRGVLSVLGGPGYTPELQLIIGIGSLYSFKTNREDSLIQRSTANTSIGFTTTGGVIGKLILKTFWNQDKMRINGHFWFKSIPDHYWGVGYENAFTRIKSDSTTAYDRLWWQINPRFLFRLKKDFYLGPLVDFNYTKGSDESPGVLADPYYQKFGPKNYNGGAGLILQYDSRDIPVNAYSGTLFQVMGAIYGGYLGGDNLYYLLDLDFRNYRQLAKTDGQTLAWNLRTRFTTGEVPYGEMSQLGTPSDLRGYSWGRLRHESMLYALAEYRHMFMKKSGVRSKSGAVVWVGGGSAMEDVTQIEDWIANFGIGYRLEVQPRMNVRFDYGFGKDSNGLYFNFTEAF